MCGLPAYDKNNDKPTDASKFGGGRPLPEYSTINPSRLSLYQYYIDGNLNK